MKTMDKVAKEYAVHEPREHRVSQHSGPGILVFSRTMQLLHVNRRALELMGDIGLVEIEPIRVVLSTPVIELHAEVEAILGSRIEANVWEPFEVMRLIGEPERKLLLRGFGLSDRHASAHSRIVILLDDARLRQAGRTEQAHALVQPAGRQAAVA